jgi:hypothetical protein
MIGGMVGVEVVLELLEVGAVVALAGMVLSHSRRSHRRLRAHRPAFDPERSHAFAPSADDAHVCSCGRELAHDVHHREGGKG